MEWLNAAIALWALIEHTAVKLQPFLLPPRTTIHPERDSERRNEQP